MHHLIALRLGLLIGLASGALLSGPARAVDADYRLNPGDDLQITVWKEDGLDRETIVLPDGNIDFPLIGTIMARGRTTAEVRETITKRLASTIPDASVTVVVRSPLGNVIDVIGQVQKPGEIATGHRLSVMQALSMAGGLTPYASEGNIRILHRDADGTEKSIPFPFDDVIRGKQLEADILLSPGDVVMVPASSLF
jgi:polysaccharide export outer membrane protein